MADLKISELAAASALTGAELLPVVQSGVTEKATGQQLMTLITGSVTLSGATVTTSQPLLNHAQTWNDGAVVFTGWKLNVTKTAANYLSRLIDLQIGGVSLFNVDTDGSVSAPFVLLSASTTGGADFGYFGSAGWNLGSAAFLSWYTGAPDATSADLRLLRRAANVMALTNASTGGAAQEFHEMTAPAAPDANRVRLYAEDNGSGKTRLMALFASGAAQQVALEP